MPGLNTRFYPELVDGGELRIERKDGTLVCELYDERKCPLLENLEKDDDPQGRLDGLKSEPCISMTYGNGLKAVENLRREILKMIHKRFGCFILDEGIHPEYMGPELEIDGNQHLQLEHKKKDFERDKIIEKEGWKVFRISWHGLSEKGKIKSREQFLKFLDIIEIENAPMA